MIKQITKQDFMRFECGVKTFSTSVSDKAILNILHDFIDDYEDDEIDVLGYFDEVGRLLGVIRFSEEELEYLFEEINNEDDIMITLIGAILVHPQHRSKGIGKELVEHAMQQATNDIVVADPFDVQAINFFTSIGFSHENDFSDDDKWLLYKEKVKALALV